jgi:hypothetical protein
LASVLWQREVDLEVVVVDDASTSNPKRWSIASKIDAYVFCITRSHVESASRETLVRRSARRGGWAS